MLTSSFTHSIVLPPPSLNFMTSNELINVINTTPTTPSSALNNFLFPLSGLPLFMEKIQQASGLPLFVEKIQHTSDLPLFIQHKHVDVGELKLHVAEIGSGPAVLLLHGFPEIWYSWRHQMIALADAGFHAIAPDFRGYGLSDQPSQIEKGNYVDLAEDMARLLDAFGIQKVFVVAKDFGANIAYYLCLLHPERVRGIVTLGFPYMRPGQDDIQLDLLPQGFYIRHWKEPGRALADFGRFDTETVVRNIYTLFSQSEMPMAEEGKEIMDLYDPSTTLPSWFTNDDLKIYSSLYEKSGFAFPVQVPYITFMSHWGKLAELTDYTIKVPVFFIMGTKDFILKSPGMEDYINSDFLRSQVPNLEIKFFPEGSHFVQEQFPEEVNKLVLGFLNQQL